MNIGLREAARRLDMDPGYLSRIETGHATPGAALAEKIAQLYGVSELQVLYPERYGSDSGKPPADGAAA